MTSEDNRMAEPEKGRYRPPMMWIWAWGCFPNSSWIATRDLFFAADSHDPGGGMQLELWVSGPEGDVVFGGTDVLTVRAGDEELALGEGPYTAPLGDFAGDLQVSLQRKNDHDVSFLAPVAPELEFAAVVDEGLQLTWEPVQGEHLITVDVQGPCIDPVWRQLVVDPGYYSLSPAEIPTRGECVLEVGLGVSLVTNGVLVQGKEGGNYTTSSSRRSILEVEWAP
jgi:hypothetical protein